MAEQVTPRCETCLGLSEDLWKERNNGDCGPTVRELKTSQEDGCPSCQVLHRAISAFFPENTIHRFSLQIRKGQLGDQESYLLLGVFVWNQLPNDPSLLLNPKLVSGLELYCHTDKPSEWPVIGPARTVSSLCVSQQCAGLSRQWLSECLETHESCSFDIGRLPQRVIWVGDTKSPPRLVESRGKVAKYAALSHCWGGIVPYQTTTSTLAQRQELIESDHLPKTFHDALTITRNLGIQYLWIDSICIIQDLQTDWIEESAKMGTYFANSTVIIAAHGADNSLKGCSISSSCYPDNLSKKCSDPGRKGEILVRPYCDGDTYIYPGHVREYPVFEDVVGGEQLSKLSCRAWTLQEIALSRRMLHFTAHEMTWECRTDWRCECDLTVRTIPNNRPSSLICDSGASKTAKSSLVPDADYVDRWEDIVTNFTQRSLTYETDRLPAFSGLAMTFQTTTNDTYICGLWKKTLLQGLAWRTVDWNLRPSSQRQTCCAPSWSWASITGRIDFFSTEKPHPNYALVNILDVGAKLATSNPFGPAESGFLNVEADIVLAEVVFERSLYSSTFVYLKVSGSDDPYPFTPDVYNIIPGSRYDASSMGLEFGLGEQLVLMVLFRDTDEIFCLVLKPLNAETCTYTRVGCLTECLWPYTNFLNQARRRILTIV